MIGIHAPVTGASPIPQTSFDVGKDIYWKFLAESAPDQLFGRNVRVVFRDDEFNPQHAVQVCREMVEQDGAFLLVGGGGADQITACAQYATENGIPYVSAGVNENGLADLDTYFASTLTYAEQAPMLIDQITAEGLTEIGLVVSDTPSFDDAMEAIKAAAEEAGITIAYETRINKTAAEPEQLSVVQELKNSGVQAVVLLSSPVVFIGLANQGLNQGFTPMWLGPGVTSGLNAVTNFGCPAVETGEFFSPTPGLDVIDQLDPDFNPAYVAVRRAAPPADDIGLQLWSLNKALALMLEATGPELGRAAFMNTLVTAPGFDNGIYSPVQFTPDDHFGGTGAAPARRRLRRSSSSRRPSSSSPRAERGRLRPEASRPAGRPRHRPSALIVVLVIAGEKQSIVIGTVTGSAYGLVALGLVLIYKSSGVFNFAQGEFGTVALCTLYLLHSNDVPYGFAVLGALLAAMLFGFLTERIVIRPLFEAPRVTLLVATAGVALLAIAIQQWLFDNQGRPIARAFPTARPRHGARRADLRPAAVADRHAGRAGRRAGLFFTRTNLGLAIIGASQEPTATELVGISVRRLSTFTWVLAALLGGLAAVIAVPDTGQFTPGVMTSGLPHPGVHGRRARRHDEPARRLPRRRAGRHHPVRRHQRRGVPGHPGHAVDAGRVPRAARRARRPSAGPAREVRLMAVVTPAQTPGDTADAARPRRRSARRRPGGWPAACCGRPSPTSCSSCRSAGRAPTCACTPSPPATRSWPSR